MTDEVTTEKPQLDDEGLVEKPVEGPVEKPVEGPVAPPWAPEAWGQAARATILTALLGMALAVSIRFLGEGGWLEDFLHQNKMPMDNRMALLGQTVGTGCVFALGGLTYVVMRREHGMLAATWERWAWFLSPAILLPSVFVMLKHQVWAQNHENLLPVVLFGALIAEVLFSKAYSNVPASVSEALRRFAEWEKPEPKSKSRAQAFLQQHAALLVVITMALAYGAFMSFYTIRWHHKLGTATFDLGINTNLLHGGLEGRFNQSPVIFPEDPQKYIANHVKLGLYAFLPLYALYPKAETLLTIQSVSLGLGAIPLFLFLRRRIPTWWAVALAASYLSYYPLHGANFYEMKEPPTAAALVLCCIYAIDAKRWVLGGFCFFWALIMREDMPIPLAMVGAVFLLSGERPRAGLIMAGIATTWFVFLRFYVMEEVGAWWFPNMYEDLWAPPEKGFRGVIKTLVSNPTFTLKHIFVEKKFWYLMHMLVPLAFLPVRRWYGWAALIPGAILTLLVTDYAPPTMFSFQYVMHWAPYFYVAAGLVLASMRSGEGGVPRAKGALTAMCLASAALSFNYGAFSLRDRALESGYHKIEFSISDKERKTHEDVKRLVASIPQSASVATTERIGPHLASRVGFYTLRRGSHGVDYIVAAKSALRLDRTKQTVRDGLVTGEYGIVGRFGEYAVFKRGADTKGNDAIMKEWGLKGGKRSSKSERDANKKSRSSPTAVEEPEKNDAGDSESELEDAADEKDASND